MLVERSGRYHSAGIPPTTLSTFILKIGMKKLFRVGEDIGLSPKFYNKIFLFVGLATLVTLIGFDWLVQVDYSNVSTTLIVIYRRGNQFIGNSFFPIDI